MTSGLHADVSDMVIGCAIEVHRHLGPGMLESVYERALHVEFEERGLSFASQVNIPVVYKRRFIATFRPDLIVCDSLVVDVKSVQHFDPVFLAQMLTYLRVSGLKVGLILNFNEAVMKNGIRRVSL